MKKVRAKFECVAKIKNSPHDEQHQIAFRAVIDGSEENKEFFKYTPSGQINLSVVSGKTAEQFEIGKKYYVDFIPSGE